MLGLYQLIKKESSAEQIDDLFFTIIDYFSCDLFFEAGAFEGTASKKIKENNPKCIVYALEANKYNFDYFKESFLKNNINYYNLAVSDITGKIEFNIQKQKKNVNLDPIKGSNSILKRNEGKILYETLSVDCVTLDSFFSDKISNTIKNIALWLDLEGFSYNALSKANKILEKSFLLKVEVESKPFWKDQKLDTDVIELMKKNNFSPLIRDYEYKNQYNVIFVKNNIIDELHNLLEAIPTISRI